MGALGCPLSLPSECGLGVEAVFSEMFLLTRSHCYRCAYGGAPVLQQSGEVSWGNMVRLHFLPSLCIFLECPFPTTTGKRDLVGFLGELRVLRRDSVFMTFTLLLSRSPESQPLCAVFPLRSSPKNHGNRCRLLSLFWFSVPTFAFLPFFLHSVSFV